jgi:hypothetical protein
MDAQKSPTMVHPATLSNEPEQAAYADVQKTPVEAEHATLPERELNRNNTYHPSHRVESSSIINSNTLHARFPSVILSRNHRVESSSALNSSNIHARIPSVRPTLSSRSPWDPDDDEFDVNVYKDMYVHKFPIVYRPRFAGLTSYSRHSNKLYKASYGSVKQMQQHRLNSRASLYTLRSKASTNSFVSATSNRAPSLSDTNGYYAAAPHSGLRHMASISSMASNDSVETIIYRPRTRESLPMNTTPSFGSSSSAEQLDGAEDKLNHLHLGDIAERRRQAKIDARLREEEERDRAEELKAELQDPACMSKNGPDLHDSIVAELYIDVCPRVLTHESVGHMHVIDHERLESSRDVGFIHAQPRLCDAIATILFGAGGSVLDRFLDSDTFTWWFKCRNETRIGADGFIIRRFGQKVIVAVFIDNGDHYIWGHNVKCVVDLTGKWKVIVAVSRLSATPIVQIQTFIYPPTGHKLWREREAELNKQLLVERLERNSQIPFLPGKCVDWESFQYLREQGDGDDVPADTEAYRIFTERKLARMLLKMVWEEKQKGGDEDSSEGDSGDEDKSDGGVATDNA